MNTGFLKERVEPLRQFSQVMAGNLRIEMVLQVIGQFQEESWYDSPAQRMGLRQGSLSIVLVREMHRQQGINPAPYNR